MGWRDYFDPFSKMASTKKAKAEAEAKKKAAAAKSKKKTKKIDYAARVKARPPKSNISSKVKKAKSPYAAAVTRGKK